MSIIKPANKLFCVIVQTWSFTFLIICPFVYSSLCFFLTDQTFAITVCFAVTLPGLRLRCLTLILNLLAMGWLATGAGTNGLGALSQNPARQRHRVLVTTAGTDWQLFSAAPCVTKQPFLGNTLLTSKEEGPRKGGLKIDHSNLDSLPHLSGHSTSAVKIKKLIKTINPST